MAACVGDGAGSGVKVGEGVPTPGEDDSEAGGGFLLVCIGCGGTGGGVFSTAFETVAGMLGAGVDGWAMHPANTRKDTRLSVAALMSELYQQASSLLAPLRDNAAAKERASRSRLRDFPGCYGPR